MKVALIGASGNAGGRILEELAARGHQVVAIARRSERIARRVGVEAHAADVNDVPGLVRLLRGCDAVISSTPFRATDPQNLFEAVRAARAPRYLVVGGAGSLLLDNGERLVDQPDFPAAFRPSAEPGAAFLDLLRQIDDIDWTFLSPSAQFVAGERTGLFRLGGDQLLRDAEGRSWISFEDYAVALVDELETPRHRGGRRFTVGY